MGKLLLSGGQNQLFEIGFNGGGIAELAKMALLNGKTFSAYEAIPSYIRDEVTWEKQPLKVGKR